MSEYHAAGSPAGAYMLRKGSYKYHYYVGMRPELFNLETDPEETEDLAQDDNYQDILIDLEHSLCNILDPEAVDAGTKAAQVALVEQYGGREKAWNIGKFGATPVPGKSDE